LPLSPEAIRDVQARAADWFEAEGLLEAALDARVAADDREALGRFLSEHGPALVIGGATAQGHRGGDRAAGGGADGATRAGLRRGVPRRAGSGARRTPRSTGPPISAATSMPPRAGGWGSSTACAAPTPRRSRCTARPSSMAASRPTRVCLDAWIASAHFHRGDVAESREAAERALVKARRRATTGRSPRPTRRAA
jgi:hypothetical protein